MKKTSLLIGTALLFGAHAATAAEDYACATPPTCAELGYTHSKNECNGDDMLYCPFDKTKVFCREVVNCEELGYTDAVADCDGTGMLKCPANSSMVKCDKRKFFQYDFYYSDGTWSTNLITGKTVIGIKQNWTSSKPHKILALKEKLVGSHSAGVSYCNSYSTAGTTAGQWKMHTNSAAGYSKAALNGQLSKLPSGSYALYFNPDNKKYYTESSSGCYFHNDSGSLGGTFDCSSNTYARCMLYLN